MNKLETSLKLFFILPLVFDTTVATKIYQCGFYVYATEGVVAGSFDANLLEHAWKTKK